MKSLILHDENNSQLGCCTIVVDSPACGAGQTFDNGANICRCDAFDHIVNADGECEPCPPNHSYDSGKICKVKINLKPTTDKATFHRFWH